MTTHSNAKTGGEDSPAVFENSFVQVFQPGMLYEGQFVDTQVKADGKLVNYVIKYRFEPRKGRKQPAMMFIEPTIVVQDLSKPPLGLSQRLSKAGVDDD